MDELTDNGFKKEGPAASSEQWLQLFGLARELDKLKPWDFFWGEELIAIKLPGRRQPVFCSSLGHDDYHALSIHPNRQALDGYLRMVNASVDEPHYVSLSYQNSLICFFDARDNLHSRDKRLIKDLGFRFRGAGHWVYFRAVATGFAPWWPNAKQVKLMIAAFEQIRELCLQKKQGALTTDIPQGKMIYRRYLPAQQAYQTELLRFPSLEGIYDSFVVRDEILVERLRRQKRLPSCLELDLIYLPTPVEAEEGHLPHFPRIIILADGLQDTVLEQLLVPPETDSNEALIEFLRDWIMQHGRPVLLSVRDERMASRLEDFCRKIGLRLEIAGAVPIIDDYASTLLEFAEELSEEE